jgi:ATP:corrinoid adenosyltransferase
MTDKQKQAVKLLDETQKKLKEQAYDMLIMDSIKVAKNIELSNKGIDIQRELDELEALQILNK